MKRKTLGACVAVLVVAVAAVGVAECSRNSDSGDTALPGWAHSGGQQPLKQTQWFRDNFGTPLVATTDVTPKNVEQANDVRGTVLPQDKSALDGPVMWQRVRCVALPFSTTDGPTKSRADGIYGGYARTAFGAALAALHMADWSLTAGSNDAVPLVIAPVDRERLTPQLPAYKRGTKIDNPSCLARQQNIVRPALWKAEAISDTVTRVQFWFPPNPGEAQGGTVDQTVVWDDGDWYMSEQTATEMLTIGGHTPAPRPRGPQPVGWSQW